jgi:hypothetical protein
MKYLFYIFFTCQLLSCSKTEVQTPLIFSEAAYKMAVTINWVSPQFSIPANAHVTSLIGMTHSKDTFLWQDGKLATIGLENVAEVGNSLKINEEIEAIIAKYKAGTKFKIPAPSITGTAETSLKVNTVFSNISFASMIAPSPDWFMGVSNVNLFQDNKWVDSLVINVKVFDAGTEEGDVFGYNNPSSVPQQLIKLLTPVNASVLANGNNAIAPIAIVRFKKL